MENTEIRSVKKRGRKRKIIDVQNIEVDEGGKKRTIGTRSKRLVGCYVRKEFVGLGVYLGKIVSYDSGLYRVDYEDGDCEDLESGEVKEVLIEESGLDGEWLKRKYKLDILISSKDEDEKVKGELKVENVVSIDDRVKMSAVSELIDADCDVEVEGVQMNDDGEADSMTDSCEDDLEQEPNSEVEVPVVPPPELPSSSGNIGIPADYVSHLFSVYSFLRSFSVQLFLSPFGLDYFVGSLNCSVPNTLLDSIQVALMRALRRYFEKLSADGSELASKCLRGMDWSLLDTLTWPIFLVHYLMVMGYTSGSEWKGFCVHALEREYYTLSAGRKLIILQILCDDVLDSEEFRTEMDAREESEVGIDQEAGIAVAPVTGPRRVHPRNSKTSACKDQESISIIAQNHETKFPFNSSHLGLNSHGQDAISNVDEDGNGDECRLCGMDGTLLCCDGCPASYHSRCIGVSKMFIPQGAWYCPECTINKSGPKLTRGTSLKAAEVFGVDVYGQAFMGSCDHLLVLNGSNNSNSGVRYYSQNEIPNLLQSLLSSTEHIVTYSEICKAIIQYWEIPEDIISFTETYEIAEKPAKDDVRCTMPSSWMPLAMASDNVPEASQSVDTASSTTGGYLGNMNKISLLAVSFSDHAGQQGDAGASSEQAGAFMSILKPQDNEVRSTMVSQSFTWDTVSSDLMGNDKSGLEVATGTSKTIIDNCRERVKGPSVTPKLMIRIKDIKSKVGKNDRDLPNSVLYMGSSFKVQGYVNNYLHGDFAASAAANLAVLSSEENQVSGSNAADDRKVMSANVSLQVKAFSLAAVRFFWPHIEKKLIEVPRERCSWCFYCKAPVVSKRGCLLNAAASNAIKSSMKIISGLRNVKCDGSVHGIAMYVIFLEENLSGLTVGPFLSSAFRSQWRRRAEQANTCSAIKLLLHELEENIRTIALSGDWIKLVDGWSAESSVVQNATNTPGSTQKRRPGRRGRKSATAAEVTADDDQELLTDFIWWRGGKLTKCLFQKAILPRVLAKKAARQGGSRKIPGVCYAETSETPKRSRRLVWRAAVEMSRNVSQLALQVRYLDFHVRWNDLSRPEQTIQDVKGSETEASAFRNAYICDKRILDNDIRYCVAFGSQKHLPSRVMKNVIEVEENQDGKEKYWFCETRIPLYLIKEYEENAAKVLLRPANKPVDAHVKLNRKKLKAFCRDIFSYLAQKGAYMEKCNCALCDKDLLLGDAVNCNTCQGLCHEQCTVSSTVRINEEVEFFITCKQCYHNKALSLNESSNESPTSPLNLQGQEFANMTVYKAEKLADCGGHSSVPVKTLQPPLESKSVSSSKSGSKSKRRSCSWGLIWKKKNCKDNGSDFRLKNILMKGTGMNFPDIYCYLCRKPYNPDLMYIRCEACLNWYHAEAVELEESKIFELFGYKCCRCRRIRTPECPYADADKKRNKVTKQDEKDSDLDVIPQPVKVDPAYTVLPNKEKVAHIKDDPLLFNPTRVEQFTEQKPRVDYEWNATTLSRLGPQKLPVRRHIKREKEAENSSYGELSTFEGNILNSVEESLSHAEWDVTANGLDDGLMFNYEDLSYEDMEFEPQTYFSFNELLASDDVVPQNVVGSSDNVAENWENSSFCPANEASDASIHQQESTIVVEHADIVPCRMCSRAEPCPDLYCQICGLQIHSHCSPWEELSFSDNGWRCGNCRDWV